MRKREAGASSAARPQAEPGDESKSFNPVQESKVYCHRQTHFQHWTVALRILAVLVDDPSRLGGRNRRAAGAFENKGSLGSQDSQMDSRERWLGARKRSKQWDNRPAMVC